MTGIALPSGQALVSGGVTRAAGGGRRGRSTRRRCMRSETGWMIRSTL